MKGIFKTVAGGVNSSNGAQLIQPFCVFYSPPLSMILNLTNTNFDRLLQLKNFSLKIKTCWKLTSPSKNDGLDTLSVSSRYYQWNHWQEMYSFLRKDGQQEDAIEIFDKMQLGDIWSSAPMQKIEYFDWRTAKFVQYESTMCW